MILYVDVLAVLNFSVDMIMLYAVSAVTGRRASWGRLAAGSLVGTVYALTAILRPDFDLFRTLPAVLLISAAMLAAVFWPFDLPAGLTLAVWFYGLSAAAGGVATLAASFSAGPVPMVPGWQLADGAAWWTAPAAALAIALLGHGAWRAAGRTRVRSVHEVSITARLEGRCVRLPGRIDTGHDAIDPLSGLPVVIAEIAAVRSLWAGQGAAVNGGDDFNSLWDELSQSSLAHRLRLFPYRVLGRDDGLLAALRLDRLRVETAAGTMSDYRDAVLALYPGRLGGHGSYRALVPLDLAPGGPTTP